MRPKELESGGQKDMFRSRLDQIVDMKHELVQLAQKIDWGFLAEKFGAVYTDKPGRPPLPTRLMAGLAILKYMHNLSDEGLYERWIENPYFQLFCGEEFFQHKAPFDRSSMTRWRQRMGEDRLAALVQESLNVATKTGAAKPTDFERVIVDTTVQPKNIAYPTDAKLMNKARERLVKLAQKMGVKLRQTYERVGKFALIKQQRYAHAKQFKRANNRLKKLKVYLGRVIRDVQRKIEGNTILQEAMASELALANRIHLQEKGQKGYKIYALHAPEVECIGKGKTHRPYEFGVKVSVATSIDRSKGGQFAVHVKTVAGKPYDGHTLEKILPDIEKSLGVKLKRVVADAGYKGHNALPDHKHKVYLSGQKRGVTAPIKRDLKRRAAVEPVIGHLKSGHRMERNFLAHRNGDAANPVLAAAGYNFRLLLKWLRKIFCGLCWKLLIVTDNTSDLWLVA